MANKGKKEGLGFKRGLALFLLALALAAAFWFLPAGADWANNLVRQAIEILGLGLILFPLFLLVLLWVAWSHPSLLWRWWHRWLGIGLFILWGLGLSSLFQEAFGGELGQLILGLSRGVGVVRLVLLGYLTLLFLAPLFTLKLTLNLARGLKGLIKATINFIALVSTGTRRFVLGVRGWLSKGEVRKPQPEIEPPQAPTGQESAAEPKAAKPIPQPKGEKKAKGLWWLIRRELPTRSREKRTAKTAAKEEKSPVITASGWELPPFGVLETTLQGDWGQLDTENKAHRLEEALTSYGVEGKVTQINVGPTVTQFGVEPGWERRFRSQREKDKNGNLKTKQIEVSRTRVKVERIQALSNDLALALAAPSIRIEAPVPGKSVVGIEVPNSSASLVGLRSVVESSTFLRLKAKAKLALALGQGTGGEAAVADLGKMPHLLMAGATGSGKSVCLNAFICCLLFHNTPEDLRLVLIDPKRVELTAYNPLPHLIGETIVDMKQAVEALNWLNLEMDSRYRRLAAAGIRNIEEYNKNHHPPLPYYILIIDELADLMMTAFEEVEHRLCRLAQLARATGIHLIVATQRPSVDVITGLIKANFPTRISFAVTSQVDSRTILDTGGAEKLLGRGDMLYLPTDAPKPKRLQGCYISDAEIQRLVTFWARQKLAETVSSWQTPSLSPVAEDPVLEAARHLAREHKQLSSSFLQRRLQIGQSRALKIMETLEKEGLIPGEKE